MWGTVSTDSPVSDADMTSDITPISKQSVLWLRSFGSPPRVRSFSSPPRKVSFDIDGIGDADDSSDGGVGDGGTAASPASAPSAHHFSESAFGSASVEPEAPDTENDAEADANDGAA